MLEKPDLDDTRLAETITTAFGIPVSDLEFLPLGADVATAVYRVASHDGTAYFLKLRQGRHFQPALVVPMLLANRVPGSVISPILRPDGSLTAHVDSFNMAMYPFISGSDGFGVTLSSRQWSALASLLRELHSLEPPPDIRDAIPRDTFSDATRSTLRMLLERLDDRNPPDAYAVELLESLHARRHVIRHLVDRTSQLAADLSERKLPAVLCHGDIHAGNVLIDADEHLMVVDWDTLILAPRERDLMFLGAGIGDVWRTEPESVAFYGVYGRDGIDQHAIAYFRMERVIEDIRAFSRQLLRSSGGGDDRAMALHYFNSQFEPGGVLDIALKSDPDL